MKTSLITFVNIDISYSYICRVIYMMISNVVQHVYIMSLKKNYICIEI